MVLSQYFFDSYLIVIYHKYTTGITIDQYRIRTAYNLELICSWKVKPKNFKP